MIYPLVSVIIPLYNSSQFVHEAIDSILEQSFVDFELIVVDDKSTDGSKEIVETIIDSRLILLSLNSNQGYPSAINAGLHIARGKYVARMDSDDLSHSDRLKEQVNFLEAHSDYVFVGCQYCYQTPRGKLFSRRNDSSIHHNYHETGWCDEDWQSVFSGERLFADASVMFRVDAAHQVGNYRTYQKSGQDVDLWLRLLENGAKAATLCKELYIQRLSHSAISCSSQTAIRNKIPRTLALERKEHGVDRIMRGEPLTELSTPHKYQGKRSHNLGILWQRADICFSAGDWWSGLGFVAKAIEIGKFSKGTIKILLRLFWRFYGFAFEFFIIRIKKRRISSV